MYKHRCYLSAADSLILTISSRIRLWGASSTWIQLWLLLQLHAHYRIIHPSIITRRTVTAENNTDNTEHARRHACAKNWVIYLDKKQTESEQTSLVMLPWMRASMCNRDNSWARKACRRGRLTSTDQRRQLSIREKCPPRPLPLSLYLSQKSKTIRRCLERQTYSVHQRRRELKHRSKPTSCTRLSQHQETTGSVSP